MTETPKDVYIFRSHRDQALVYPNLPRDPLILSFEAPSSSSIPHLCEYLHNDNLFPRSRPILIHLVGGFPLETRTAIAARTRDIGAAIVNHPDALRLVSEGGPAEVVYAASRKSLVPAETLATLLHHIHGTRYVAVAGPEDYRSLRELGAVVPSVVSVGGPFPVAAEESGWRVAGSYARPRPGAPPTVTVIESDREILDELLRLNRQDPFGRGGSTSAGSSAGPGNPLPPVDVVFYTSYGGQGQLEVDPLSFPALDGSVTPYVTAMDSQGQIRLRPDALPVVLDYQNDPQHYFTNECAINGSYDPTTVGWNCEHDEQQGTETNYFDEAVKGKAEDQLSSLRQTNVIRNVVIISHWLDIPYRQKLFPYHPFDDCGNCFYPQNPPYGGNHTIVDADNFSNDQDNDWKPGGCQIQSAWRSSSGTGCALDKDPETEDDAWDGDTGALDFFLADFRQDLGDPFKYAHAGFGRITGHDTVDAGLLIGTANAYIDCRLTENNAPLCAPSGATAVAGWPHAAEYGSLDTFRALMECRYGAGSPLIRTPCDGDPAFPLLGCPNETTNPHYNMQTNFLEVASQNGEIVQAVGHNVQEWMDHQRVDFKDLQPNGVDTDIVSSDGIFQFLNSGGQFKAGVWTLHASEAAGYAFHYNPCAPGQPCELDCTASCFQSQCATDYLNACWPAGCQPGCFTTDPVNDPQETSFVHELIPGGVLAMLTAFSGHVTPPSIKAGDVNIFLREISQGTPLGEAARLAGNKQIASYDPSDDLQAYELRSILIGDPLASLPPPQATCPDAPTLIVGKGDAPEDPVGVPRVMGFRSDAVPLSVKLNFRPFGDPGIPGTSHYGNDVAAGEFDLTNTADEIVVAHGANYDCAAFPCNQADATVKVTYTDGTMVTNGLFFAFPTQGPVGGPEPAHTDFGVDITVGDFANTIAPQEIVAGRGPGAVFGPQARGFKYQAPLGGGPPQFQAMANLDFYAFPRSTYMYGVTVTAAEVDSSYAGDELATGLGPGPTYPATVKTWTVPFPSQLQQFDAFPATAVTYGATVGAGDVDGDGTDELFVGKGIGDQLGSSPGTMSSEVEVHRLESGAWVRKLTIDAFPDSEFPLSEPGFHAGARGVGADLDGNGTDEVIISRGPVSHMAAWYEPTGVFFMGSHVRGYDVDPATWTATKSYDSFAFEDEEANVPKPSTRGARVSPIWSTAISYPYQFQGAKGGSRPVWPWLSPEDALGGLAAYTASAAPELFEDGSQDKRMLEDLLGQAAAKLRQQDRPGAKGMMEQVENLLPVIVKNVSTFGHLSRYGANVKSCIAQAISGSPPVALIEGVPVYTRSYAMPDLSLVPVTLDGGRSTDADSTPGTNDNILSYRWFDADGNLADTGEQGTIFIRIDDPTKTSTNTITLVVEDAYGETATATAAITFLGRQP